MPIEASPSNETAKACVIVCDVALDNLFLVEELRGLLVQHRAAPDTPVHFIVRDGGIYEHAVANALGATTISSDADLSPLGGHAAVFRWLSAFDGRDEAGAPEPEPDEPSAEADIALVAESLARILGAAALRKPFLQSDLDAGVAALLRSTRVAGIAGWVEIVRRYDDATYQHCLLVAGLTAAFASQLGVSVAKQRILMQGALLHDIGKARVPLAILNKAGALTESEQKIVRKHPSDGYYMLARQAGLEPSVLDIVLHHHEMLDGSGYPDGLRRDQISDSVRIVTICDVGAALLEKRAYKRSMSPHAAYAMLVGMIGKLDGALVAAFKAILDDIDRHDPVRASA